MISLDFLRPLKTQYMETCYDMFAEGSHTLQYDIIKDATVAVPPGVSRNAPVVADDGTTHPYSREDDDPPHLTDDNNAGVEYTGMTVLYGGYLDPHWGHFLMESLSRLWPVFLSNIKVDKIVFASHLNSLDAYAPNIREALRLAGVIDKVELVTKPRRFARIVVPQRAISPRHFACREANAVYDAVARQAIAEKGVAKTPSRRIYLSRTRLPKARANEPGIEWLDRYFAENGFEVIFPESLSLVDMIIKIQESDIVAAMSGTLPHNLVFGRYGTKTWIIEKTPVANNFQPGVDLLRELDVTYVDASALIWTTSAGLGPFIVYPNDIFSRFARKAGLTEPHQWSDKEKRKALARYVRMYNRHYGRQWILDEWEEEEIGLLREAWRDTMTDYGSWIRGELPITLGDAIAPRALLKRLYHRLRKTIGIIHRSRSEAT